MFYLIPEKKMENKPKFQALNFNVIVEETVLKNVSEGGFDIAGYVSKTESNQAGIVISVGEGCPNVDGKSSIEEGQTVIFSKHRATVMTIDTKPYLVVPYQDIVLRM